MASTRIDKKYWRALCDELDEKLGFDKQELARLEAEVKAVKDRMAATRQQLDELTCKTSGGADASASSSSNQSTLAVKKAKLTAVRSIGVQTD